MEAEPVQQLEEHRDGRAIADFEPGASTAVPSNVAYRLGKIRELGILRGDWLDCGCADGGYTAHLVELGAESATGVDPDGDRIGLARERTPAGASVRFVEGTAEALPFAEDCFDGVLLNEVLEHVRDERRALREIRRVLRPGGYLVIMSPNRWFPFEGHGMRVGGWKFDSPVPLLPWMPTAVSRHFTRARNYWSNELCDLVRTVGLSVRVAGYAFPVFEVYPWLPAPVIRRYRTLVPVLERLPVVRRFGVSNFVVAQK